MPKKRAVVDVVEEREMTDVLPERGFKAPGTGHMIAGSLLGAVGAYLYQVIGSRRLGPVAFEPISLLWTSFFILATVVLIPLEQYVTREASRGRRVLRADIRPILAVTVAAGVIGGGFGLATRTLLFDGRGIFALQLALLLIGYSVMLVGKGVLAGHRRFEGVGWILFWESTLRLAAGALILSFAPRASAFAWAMVLGPLAALGTRFWRHDRPISEAPATDAGGFLGAYIAGSAASQLLLAGAPLGVALLGGSPELVSITFVTFTLYRGPLTLIYALQGRILPYLVRMTDEGSTGPRRLALTVVAGGGVLAVLGGLVGWLVGPQVVSVLFGGEFEPDRLVAALAAGGVVAASTAQVAGQVLVAAGGTGRLAIAWSTGLIVAIFIVGMAGMAPDRTVAWAFAVGELTAAVVVAIMTLGARRPAPTAV